MIIDWVMLEQTGTFLVQAKYFTAWPYQSVNKYILLFLIVFYNINTVKLKGQKTSVAGYEKWWNSDGNKKTPHGEIYNWQGESCTVKLGQALRSHRACLAGLQFDASIAIKW